MSGMFTTNKVTARIHSCEVCVHNNVCAHKKEYKEYYDKIAKVCPEETDMFYALCECLYYECILKGIGK